MSTTELARVILIGGGVGLATYCLLCAAHVWQARNARLSGGVPAGEVNRYRRLAGLIGLAGVVAAGGVAAWNTAAPQEGLLLGRDLFTVRMPPNLMVQRLADATAVTVDTELAAFHSPERAAEMDVLRLQQESLQAEQRILRAEPLAGTPEALQQLAEGKAQRRDLEGRLANLTLDQDRLRRETLLERLAKQDEIARLRVAMSRIRGELEQARCEQEHLEREWARSQALDQRGVVTEEELAEKAKNVLLSGMEVQQLERQLTDLQAEKAGLEEGTEALTALADEQSRARDAEMESLARELEAIAEELERLTERHREDVVRARRHRDERLQKIKVELEQTGRAWEGLAATTRVVAPFPGRVVYRDPAPGSAPPGEPLLVVASGAGVCFQVRLPRWVRPSLEDTEQVTVELIEERQRGELQRFAKHRFAGRLVDWQDLPDDPRRGLATFTCTPPAGAVRQLASKQQVAAKLLWRAPLHASPAFRISGLLTGIGGGMWLLISLIPVRRRKDVPPPSAKARLSDEQHALATEFGAEGVVLHALGVQLREAIVRGELDVHLVAAVEWALDRHRHRAVRLIGAALADRETLGQHLTRLAADHHGSNGEAAETLARLRGVLRVLAPTVLAGWDGGHKSSHRFHGKEAGKPARQLAN